MFAFEGTFAGVRPQVCLEVRLLPKPTPALVALELPGPGVRLHVPLDIAKVGKNLRDINNDMNNSEQIVEMGH